MRNKRSKTEERFLELWNSYSEDGHEDPLEQYRFHEKRLFRFDFAWPSILLAVECDGYGGYRKGPGRKSKPQPIMGGHQTPKGMTNDRIKQNLAISDGWTVMRFTPTMLTKREGPGSIIQVLYVYEKLKTEWDFK